jgi:hypothetical protein
MAEAPPCDRFERRYLTGLVEPCGAFPRKCRFIHLVRGMGRECSDVWPIEGARHTQPYRYAAMGRCGWIASGSARVDICLFAC